MKKIMIFLLLAFLTAYPTFNFKNFAQASANPIYAKVEYKNVYFYSLAENHEENKLFILPHTYFVKLLASENDDFYYAQYGEIFGYVLKTSVTAMNGIPSSPFATYSFRVFSMEGSALYNKPTENSEKLTSIPYLCENLTFYGILQGQEVIPEKTNQWYFAKYNETGSFGYIYSVFCDKLPQIIENTETFAVIEDQLFVEATSPKELSPTAMAFIIIGVSLPCLIVLYLLIKPTMLKEKLTKPKPKLRAKSNRDYFEFDESDLN